ncbi:unnamed protein product [Clonostachys rosea]|uniref:SHSP domain-containing protein n=1 Tax=Bionectria ochroleuca TaxID=29856 RepID=A0ABY6UJ99_BIOOC|nr:unnamed protein product [Clonostachys rosea]
MAFFMSHSAYHPQASFTPVFRVVNNDRYSRCGGAYHFYRPAPRPWNPRFNVRETEDAYIINGELPGLNKDHVTVEFPEPQKIVIRGRVERNQDAAAQPTTQEEQQPSASSSATAAPTQATSEDSASTHSYQATVEDDDESDDFEVLEKASEKGTQDEAQRQLETEAEQQHQQEHSAEEPQQQQQRCRRGVREFTRTFTFPAHVDADFVTADLKDGLLNIVVPKAKPEPRHITIN